MTAVRYYINLGRSTAVVHGCCGIIITSLYLYVFLSRALNACVHAKQSFKTQLQIWLSYAGIKNLQMISCALPVRFIVVVNERVWLGVFIFAFNFIPFHIMPKFMAFGWLMINSGARTVENCRKFVDGFDVVTCFLFSRIISITRQTEM